MILLHYLPAKPQIKKARIKMWERNAALIKKNLRKQDRQDSLAQQLAPKSVEAIPQ